MPEWHRRCRAWFMDGKVRRGRGAGGTGIFILGFFLALLFWNFFSRFPRISHRISCRISCRSFSHLSFSFRIPLAHFFLSPLSHCFPFSCTCLACLLAFVSAFLLAFMLWFPPRIFLAFSSHFLSPLAPTWAIRAPCPSAIGSAVPRFLDSKVRQAGRAPRPGFGRRLLLPLRREATAPRGPHGPVGARWGASPSPWRVPPGETQGGGTQQGHGACPRRGRLAHEASPGP
jgi:hypothetical protein